MRISDWSSDVCSSDLVTLPSGESWRESAAFAGGDTLVVVDTPLGRLGLSICYDLRFPELYRALVDRGAPLLAIPSAFTVSPCAAHWPPPFCSRLVEPASFYLSSAPPAPHAHLPATSPPLLYVST